MEFSFILTVARNKAKTQSAKANLWKRGELRAAIASDASPTVTPTRDR